MKDGQKYRGARRNEARRNHFCWRALDMIVMLDGTRQIKHPFEQLNTAPVPGYKPNVGSHVAAREEDGRYNGHILRLLRAERGVGPVKRVDFSIGAARI